MPASRATAPRLRSPVGPRAGGAFRVCEWAIALAQGVAPRRWNRPNRPVSTLRPRICTTAGAVRRRASLAAIADCAVGVGVCGPSVPFAKATSTRSPLDAERVLCARWRWCCLMTTNEWIRAWRQRAFEWPAMVLPCATPLEGRLSRIERMRYPGGAVAVVARLGAQSLLKRGVKRVAPENARNRVFCATTVALTRDRAGSQSRQADAEVRFGPLREQLAGAASFRLTSGPWKISIGPALLQSSRRKRRRFPHPPSMRTEGNRSATFARGAAVRDARADVARISEVCGRRPRCLDMPSANAPD
jgi:hypothetical protein